MRLKSKMENNETHIIRRILKGETALYENFLNQYGQQVFSLIARIICNQEDAEELTQDVFLKAFQHLSSFKAESSFSTWIYSIAYNTAISAARKRKFDTFAMDDTLLANISEQQVDETLNDESEEMIIKLNRAIEKLNSDERALITLFYYEEKTMNETALILGLTESNAGMPLLLSQRRTSHAASRMSSAHPARAASANQPSSSTEPNSNERSRIEKIMITS